MRPNIGSIGAWHSAIVFDLESLRNWIDVTPEGGPQIKRNIRTVSMANYSLLRITHGQS